MVEGIINEEYLHWFPFASGCGGCAQLWEIVESTHFAFFSQAEANEDGLIVIVLFYRPACTWGIWTKANIVNFYNRLLFGSVLRTEPDRSVWLVKLGTGHCFGSAILSGFARFDRISTEKLGNQRSHLFDLQFSFLKHCFFGYIYI